MKTAALLLSLTTSAAFAASAAPSAIDAFRAVAIQEETAGHPAQAFEQIEKALSVATATHAPEDLKLADLLKEKLLLSFELGKAEPLDETAGRMLKILVKYRAHDDSVDFQGPVLAVASQFEKHGLPKAALKLLEASLQFPKRPVFVEVRAAQAHAQLGETPRARENLRRFFEACEKYEDLCSAVEMAKAHNTAGQLDLADHELKNAAQHFGQVTELSPGTRSTLPPGVLMTAEYGLGEAARAAGKRDDACTLFARALKDSESDPNGLGLKAFGLSGVARMALDDGKPADAEKPAEESYAIRSSHAEKGLFSAVDVARSASLLGSIRLQLGKLDEAEKLLTLALKTYTERLGADSPDALVTRYHLALLSHARGNDELAGTELKQLTAQLEAKLGERDPATILAHLAVGKITLEQDDLFAAEASFRDTLRLTKKSSAEEAETKQWLGVIRMRRGDYPSALKLLEAASKSHTKLFGAESSQLSGAQLALGECLTKMHKFKTARVVLEKVLALKTPQDEPGLAAAQVGLAQLELATGKLERAGQLFKSALDSRKKIYGQNSLLTAQCLAGLGRVQAASGEMDKGIGSLEQALAIRESMGKPDTWQKGEDYLHLAELYEKAGKTEKALVTYRKSVTIFRQSYWPELPEQIQQAVDGMVRGGTPATTQAAKH